MGAGRLGIQWSVYIALSSAGIKHVVLFFETGSCYVTQANRVLVI